MVIAVNTRFLLSDYLEGYGYFIYETFKRITQNHPDHQFIFIFDRPYDKRFIFGPNVTAVVTGPPARHPLLWKFWYDEVGCTRNTGHVFVSTAFVPGSRVPQCLVLHDLAFLHHPSFIPSLHLRFYKKYTGKFLQKAASVATVSEFSRADILSHYTIEENKISVLYNAAKEIFQPLNEEEKAAVKNRYTQGKEYFVYAGAIHPRKNLMNLLRAFSVFKKRQQSGMKLVLAGRLAWKYQSFTEKLKSYKYRDDVLLTGYVEESELAKLMGAAYVLVYPSLHEGFGVPVLEAMQCGVPVITSSGSSMQEIAGDAALYANANDHTAIADCIMRLYKDENLRNHLIEKGRVAAKQFSWDKTAALFWESILKAGRQCEG
jgi:glycosyltransferase involved in cell wall biosynthesis